MTEDKISDEEFEALLTIALDDSMEGLVDIARALAERTGDDQNDMGVKMGAILVYGYRAGAKDAESRIKKSAGVNTVQSSGTQGAGE